MSNHPSREEVLTAFYHQNPLRCEFELMTGMKCGDCNDLDNAYEIFSMHISIKYVEWLEAKINL
jgi:hypothetical protein